MAEGKLFVGLLLLGDGTTRFLALRSRPFPFLRIFSLSLGFQLSIGPSTPDSIPATIAWNPEGSRLGLGGLGPRSPS